MKKIVLLLAIIITSMILIACDNSNNVSVKFDTNGGSYVAEITLEAGGTISLPTPTKEGYNFVGWYTDPEFKTKYDASNVNENLTLYAKWEILSFSISYLDGDEEILEAKSYEYKTNISNQPSPEKEGYAFVGWYVNAELTEEFDLSIMPARDLTLYAKWEANKHRVEYIVNGIMQTEMAEVVDYNTLATKPTDPSKVGYTFDGWFTPENEKFDFAVDKVVGNIVLTAKFSINTYKLSLMMSNDSTQAYKEVEYVYNSQLSTPENPKMTGYTFAGWVDKDGNKVSFTGAKMPANDLVVYATWNINSYNVTYIANGGTCEKDSDTVDYNSNIVLPSVSKTGYTFNGWYLDSNFAEAAPAKMPAEDIILYAKWTVNKYSVAFDTNGSTSPKMPNLDMTYDVEASLTNNTYSREGYTFTGWNTKADGSGTSYADGVSVKNLTSANGSTVTLYAVWNENSYKVVFNANGGNGSMEPQSFKYSQSQNLKANSINRTGYTFVGWNTNSDGSGTSYADGQDVSKLSSVNNSEVLLYAIWSENTYKVVFNANDGSNAKVEQSFTYTESKKLTKNSFTRTGYTFLGWATSADSDTATYNDEEQVLNALTAENNAVINLYAVWQINSHKFTIIYNDDVTPNKEVVYDYNEAVESVANPSKAGYEFAGWLIQGSNETFSFDGFKMPDYPVTIYATYKDVYTITFDLKGGVGEDIKPISGVAGITITAPEAAPTKAGYDFNHWYLNDETVAYVFDKLPAENITLNAYWTAKVYSVTVNDGLNTNVTNLEYGALLSEPAAREGYTFLGWYTDEALSNKVTHVPLDAENLYANWLEHSYSVVFNANGGTGEMNPQTFNYSESKALTSKGYTKAGYTFVEWNTKADGNGTSYENEKEVSKLSSVNNSEITLYAIWSENSYKVVFNANNGTADKVEQTFKYTDTKALTANSFTKTGYTFLGWSTDSSSNTVEYIDGKLIDKALSEIDGYVINLYAVWEENSYKVVFNANGGTGSMSDQVFKYTDSKALSSNTLSKEHYSFVEWNTMADGNGTKYTDGQVVSKLSADKDGVFTLYAIWKIDTFEIKFIIPEAKPNAKAEITITAPWNANLNDLLNSNKEFAAKVNKVGYTFNGWSDGTNIIELNTSTVKSAMTLTATYTVEKTTLQFIVNNKLMYTVEFDYATKFTIDDFIELVNNRHNALVILKEKLEVFIALYQAGSPDAAAAFNAVNAYLLNEDGTPTAAGALILSISADMQEAAQSGAPDKFHNLVSAEVITHRQILALYSSNNNTPVIDGRLLTGWVYGENTIYESYIGGEEYQGFIPVSIDDEAASIVATFIDAPALDTNYDEETLTLDWTSEKTELEAKLNEIFIPDAAKNGQFAYGFEYSLYDLTNGKETLLVNGISDTNYIFMTGDTFNSFGTYNICVKAKITITYTYTEDENIIKQVSTLETMLDSNLSVVVILEPEDTTIDSSADLVTGDFYYKTDNVYNLFTNMNYVFSSEVELAENTDSEIVSYDEKTYTISTMNKVGRFYMTYKGTVYTVNVLPNVTQFTFGTSLQNYKTSTSSENSLFLNKEKPSTYEIGAQIQGLSYLGYDNNGFVFDLSVKGQNGVTVNLDSTIQKYFEDYLVYTFKDSKGNVVEVNDAFASFENNEWVFNAANVGETYTVEIKINDYYVPNKVKQLGAVEPLSLTFKLNDCVNVFNHKELQSAFADLSTKGINIHAKIEAELSTNQIYNDNAKNNEALLYLDELSNVNKYGQGIFHNTGKKFDNSPINIHYTDMFKLAKAGKLTSDNTGNVYLRANMTQAENYDSDTSLHENYVINGNYFEIDGSKLGFISTGSIGDLSDVPGYEIANCQTGIFYYLVSNHSSNGTTSKSSITYNNLMVTGNTSNSQYESAIETMNRNSGGYCGLMNVYGSTAKVNNCVVRNTTIAIYGTQKANLNVDYTYSLSNWANTIYSHGAGDTVVTNSHIKDSGGAAIHLEDIESTLADLATPKVSGTLVLDDATIIENYVSGEEGYFKANSMELTVMTIKAKLESLLSGHPKKVTMLTTVKNNLGLETEKINLIALLFPAGANREDNNGAKTCMISATLYDQPLGTFLDLGTTKYDYEAGTFVQMKSETEGIYAQALPSDQTGGIGNLVLVCGAYKR